MWKQQWKYYDCHYSLYDYLPVREYSETSVSTIGQHQLIEVECF